MRNRSDPIQLTSLFGKVVPHSLEAEMALLGAMLIDPAMIPDISRTTKLEDFYSEHNRRIFDAILRVFSATRTVDLVLLQDELAKAPDYDKLADFGYLQELMKDTPFHESGTHYANSLRQKSKLRELILACGDAIHRAYTQPDDVDATIGSAFESVARLARNGSELRVVTKKQAYEMVLADLESGKPANIRTGIDEIDLIAGGLPREAVVTIMGIPGSGKSTLAMQIATNLEAGLPATESYKEQPPMVVRYYSVEQGPKRAAATMISQETGIGTHGLLNSGLANADERWKVAEATLKIKGDFALFESSMDPNQLFAECAALSTKYPQGALFVDYLQDIAPFGTFTETTPKITECMRILARIARELGWLVVVVSQVDKSSSKLHLSPRMTDGLGSSAIEQRSDCIMYVHRPHSREMAPPQSSDEFGLPDNAREAWAARQVRTRVGIVKNKYGCTGVNELQFAPTKWTKFITPEAHVMRHWEELTDG